MGFLPIAYVLNLFFCFLCRQQERLTGLVNTLLQASEMLISDCKGQLDVYLEVKSIIYVIPSYVNLAQKVLFSVGHKIITGSVRHARSTLQKIGCLTAIIMKLSDDFDLHYAMYQPGSQHPSAVLIYRQLGISWRLLHLHKR